MGQTGSNLMRKIVSPIYGGGNASNPDQQITPEASQKMLARWGGNPFVFSRNSGLYMDEDGHVAHEFYEEFVSDDVDRHHRDGCMRRLKRNIRPLGSVDLPHPCLNFEFPIVICEAPQETRR